MFSKRRVFFGVLLVCLVSLSSWGFLVHRTINQIAVYNLPEPLRSFFHKDKAYLVYNAPRPDIRRNSDKSEATKHFIDLEKYGPNAANNMPMDWASAVKKYSVDTLKEYGWGPYNVMIQLDKLNRELKILSNRGRFIKAILDERLKINNVSKVQIVEGIELLKLEKIDDSFDYLLRMPIYSLTKELFEKLKEDFTKKKEEIKILEMTEPKDMYLLDLSELKKKFK